MEGMNHTRSSWWFVCRKIHFDFDVWVWQSPTRFFVKLDLT